MSQESLPAQSLRPFRHFFRVRYAELDPQGVVFNARYLEYADLAITEYWRHVGLKMLGEGALEFHVARAEVNFLRPIRADEIICAAARTTHIGNSSMTTQITLSGAQASDLRRNGTAQMDTSAQQSPQQLSEFAGDTTQMGDNIQADRFAQDQRAIIDLTNVHVDLASGQSLRIPENVRALFEEG